MAACAALFTAACVPAWSLTISSPTEGQSVRGKVPIIIPRSSLSSDVSASGFIAIKINGQFCSAIGISGSGSDEDSPKSEIVYLWDTKSTRVTGRGEATSYNDGKYEITVETHSTGGRDTIVGSSKVNVNLKNQIDQANPAPPINLSYKYILGQVSDFKYTTTAEVFDKYGFSLSGGQPPIMGEFVVGQSVEDSRRDGTALIRYKVDKNRLPYSQVLGTVSMLGQTQRFRSIYRILDATGKVLEANVFTTRTVGDVSDCLLALPGSPVKKGATWPTVFHVMLEGISSPTDLTGQSYFDSLEWESGIECVKIASNWNGNMSFPGFAPGSVPVKASGTSFYAYKVKKLIKQIIVIEFSTNVGSDVITKLQSTVPAAVADSSAAAGSSAPAATYSQDSSDGSAGAGGTPVKVRLTVVQELIRK